MTLTGEYYTEEIEPKVKRKRKKAKEPTSAYREQKVEAHVTFDGKGIIQRLGEK